MNTRHVAIVCKDMDKMLEFYQGLGFVPIYDKEEKVRIVKLQDNHRYVLELLQYESMSETTLRRLGISHISFTLDPEGNAIEMVSEK